MMRIIDDKANLEEPARPAGSGWYMAAGSGPTIGTVAQRWCHGSAIGEDAFVIPALG
jgi:hypothetical protein